MAIIKQNKNGITYVYEVSAYRQNSKIRHKWKSLGKLDINGNLIPSKKAAARAAIQAQNLQSPQTPLLQLQQLQGQHQAEVQEKTTETIALTITDTPADTPDNQAEPPLESSEIPIIAEFMDKMPSNESQLIIEVDTIEPEKAGELRNITTIVPKKSFNCVDKVNGVIFSPKHGKHLNDPKIPSIKIKNGKKIMTLVSLDFKGFKSVGLPIPKEVWLSPFDREVHNAVITLYAAGNKHFTPKNIFMVLSGCVDQKKDVNFLMREEIIRSVMHLAQTTVEIDASMEIKAGYNLEGKYRGSIVPVERVEAKLNGQYVHDCFHLIGVPPLYSYASGKKQIEAVDLELLNTPLSNTYENIELKGYLIRYISSVKNSHSNLKPIIRYDTLFEYLRVKAPTSNALKHKYKQIRDKVKVILDYWTKPEIGFISGYEEEREGRSIAKVAFNFSHVTKTERLNIQGAENY